MPFINCNCSHLKVCEHRGKIEEAWRRVVSVHEHKTWEDIARVTNNVCPYRLPEEKSEKK